MIDRIEVLDGVFIYKIIFVGHPVRKAQKHIARMDSNANWWGGFSWKLSSAPLTIAELLDIINGLQLCWNMRYNQIVVWSDSIEAMHQPLPLGL